MTFDICYDTKDIYIGRPKQEVKLKPKTSHFPKDITDSDKPLVSHNVKKTDSDYIKRRRNELHLTQKELAVKCNLNVKVIQEYENGTAIVNNKVLANIKRHLQS